MNSVPSPTLAGPAPVPPPASTNLWHYWAVAVLGLSLFFVTVTGYPNLTDNEWRISAYVLDAIHNGHWFVQTDTVGDVASKPPLLTWLVSMAVLPTGHITRFALYWPSAMATIVIALLLLRLGSAEFGWRAGYFAAFTYLLSYAALNQMSMPRYDGLLAVTVALGAWAAFRAWQTGQGWTLFWLFAALGTLVKGPLALLLTSAGLVAACFCRADNKSLWRRSHLTGVAIYLLITGGWFALAYLQMGDPLINKMIKRELVGHAVSGYAEGRALQDFFDPLWSVFRSYAPWFVLSLLGVWRVWRTPAPDARERAFERFLVAWIVIGLLVFTLASHQRGRLILPLIPAVALLGARELSRWTAALRLQTIHRWTAGVCLAALLGTLIYAHLLLNRSRGVQQTLAAKALADELDLLAPGEFPLTYVDNFHPLQVWSSTHRTIAPPAEAEALLQADTPAFVVLRRHTLPLETNRTAHIHEVFRWPQAGKPEVRILSNQPTLKVADEFAFWLEGIQVSLSRAWLNRGDEDELNLSVHDGARATLLNRTSVPRDVTLRIAAPGAALAVKTERLLPGVPLVLSWPPVK